jgi:hypothetical protein
MNHKVSLIYRLNVELQIYHLKYLPFIIEVYYNYLGMLTFYLPYHQVD